MDYREPASLRLPVKLWDPHVSVVYACSASYFPAMRMNQLSILSFATSVSVVVTPFLLGACIVVAGISGYRMFHGSDRGDAPGMQSALESGLHAWPLLLATLFSAAVGVYCFRKLRRLGAANARSSLAGK